MDKHYIADDTFEQGAHPEGLVFKGRVLVSDTRGVGFGIGFIPAGHEARQVTGGPLVPGPWAYAYGLPAVIAQDGGTGTEIANERAAGLLIECAVGDLLNMQGHTFRITLAGTPQHPDRHNIKLTEVGDVELDELARIVYDETMADENMSHTDALDVVAETLGEDAARMIDDEVVDDEDADMERRVVVTSTHRHCDKCLEAQASAETMARVTGSTGAVETIDDTLVGGTVHKARVSIEDAR